MYVKLGEDGTLQYPPDEIKRSIQAMKDAGFKPLIDSKPGYDVETQDAVFVDYIDSGIYIRAIYEVVEIEPTDDEVTIEQTNKAMEFLSINLDSLLPKLNDEQALQVPNVFPKWVAGKAYAVGDRVLYQGTLYKVLQAHTSQATWEPDVAPSLFAEVLINKDDSGTQTEIPEWKQPESTNPYMKGDKVKFEGKTYESTIDNNVWSPTAYPQGWKEVTDVQ